jgi:hypothetical protein
MADVGGIEIVMISKLSARLQGDSVIWQFLPGSECSIGINYWQSEKLLRMQLCHIGFFMRIGNRIVGK